MSTTVNLSAPVTRDQYIATVTEFALALNRLGDRYDWCSSRHSYFHGIIPEYTRHASNFISVDQVPEEADFAACLRTIRAKGLYWVNQGSVTLSEANGAFRDAGLPEYAPEGPAGTRITFSGEFTGDVNVTGDNPAQWLRDHLAEILTTNMNDAKMEEYRIVVGTAAVRITYGPYASVVNTVHIPAADILTPDYV